MCRRSAAALCSRLAARWARIAQLEQQRSFCDVQQRLLLASSTAPRPHYQLLPHSPSPSSKQHNAAASDGSVPLFYPSFAHPYSSHAKPPHSHHSPSAHAPSSDAAVATQPSGHAHHKKHHARATAHTHEPEGHMSDADILKRLAGYLWPADKPEYKRRVAGALGLLVASKVLNVQVINPAGGSVFRYFLHSIVQAKFSTCR